MTPFDIIAIIVVSVVLFVVIMTTALTIFIDGKLRLTCLGTITWIVIGWALIHLSLKYV